MTSSSLRQTMMSSCALDDTNNVPGRILVGYKFNFHNDVSIMLSKRSYILQATDCIHSACPTNVHMQCVTFWSK